MLCLYVQLFGMANIMAVIVEYPYLEKPMFYGIIAFLNKDKISTKKYNT